MYRKVYLLLFIFLTLALTGSLVAQDPGTANLTHLWTFEDGTANDQVGVADGTPVGEDVYFEDGDLLLVPGATNQADSWVELPGSDIAMDTYDEVSVAAWFTPDLENTQWNALWFFGNDGNGAGVGSDGFCFQPSRGDDVARTWISCGDESAPYSIEDAVNDTTGGGTEYNDLELHHVVCMISDEAIQGVIKMYHNGVYLGADTLESDPATGKDNAIWNISPNFARFAHSCYSADLPYLGRIHEIAIFNKALSADEVTFLFNAGVNGFPTFVKSNNTQLPEEFSLSQNYPNPFNPTTEISYSLKQREQVKLTVFDLLGSEVAILVDGFQNPGMHAITFDAHDLISGVYYYQLRTGTGTITKKMVLMK